MRSRHCSLQDNDVRYVSTHYLRHDISARRALMLGVVSDGVHPQLRILAGLAIKYPSNTYIISSSSLALYCSALLSCAFTYLLLPKQLYPLSLFFPTIHTTMQFVNAALLIVSVASVAAMPTRSTDLFGRAPDQAMNRFQPRNFNKYLGNYQQCGQISWLGKVFCWCVDIDQTKGYCPTDEVDYQPALSWDFASQTFDHIYGCAYLF